MTRLDEMPNTVRVWTGRRWWQLWKPRYVIRGLWEDK